MPTEPLTGSLTDNEIAELRRLDSATPEPFAKAHNGYGVTAIFRSLGPGSPVPDRSSGLGAWIADRRACGPKDELALDLAVAARNALPRLLDELDLLRRRDREQAAGEEVLRQQLRDAERRIEMLRVELGQRGR